MAALRARGTGPQAGPCRSPWLLTSYEVLRSARSNVPQSHVHFRDVGDAGGGLPARAPPAPAPPRTVTEAGGPGRRPASLCLPLPLGARAPHPAAPRGSLRASGSPPIRDLTGPPGLCMNPSRAAGPPTRDAADPGAHAGVSARLARWPSQASSLPRASDRWPRARGGPQPARPCTPGSALRSVICGVRSGSRPSQESRPGPPQGGPSVLTYMGGQVRGLHGTSSCGEERPGLSPASWRRPDRGSGPSSG